MAELNLQWWNDIADLLAAKIVPPVFRNSPRSENADTETSGRANFQQKQNDFSCLSGSIPPRPPSSPRSGQPPRGCSESSPDRPEYATDVAILESTILISELPAHLASNTAIRTAFVGLEHPTVASGELDLWGCGLSDVDLAAIIRLAVAHRCIRSIDLGRNTAGPCTSAEIARLLEAVVPLPPDSPSPPALTSLRLNGCCLGDDGLRTLAGGLASNVALQVRPDFTAALHVLLPSWSICLHGSTCAISRLRLKIAGTFLPSH